jgi:hypothetical protein
VEVVTYIYLPIALENKYRTLLSFFFKCCVAAISAVRKGNASHVI